MVANILILLIGLVFLAGAANFLVSSSVKIAKRFNISEVLVGLTIVAAGTSAPEIAVSVQAALKGEGALSVGNVIGSNIFNLGFILGVVALISPIKIYKKMVYRDIPILFFSSAIVLFFMWNQSLTRIEGIILLLMLVGYNFLLFFQKDIPEADEETGEPAKWYDFLILLASLGVLIFSADQIVQAASSIATSFGVSEWAIGATIVAAGTSLPELVTSIVASLKKQFGLAVGNVIGSDIFNALGIIGVSSLVKSPLELESKHLIFGHPENIISMVLLLVAIVIIGIMMRTDWKLSRLEGALLVLISVGRMGLEIYLGTS